MNALGYTLVLAALAGFIALLALWLVAENRWSKRSRIILGSLTILTTIPVTALVAVAVTQLDDQSYYAASVRTLQTRLSLRWSPASVVFCIDSRPFERSRC